VAGLSASHYKSYKVRGGKVKRGKDATNELKYFCTMTWFLVLSLKWFSCLIEMVFISVIEIEYLGDANGRGCLLIRSSIDNPPA